MSVSNQNHEELKETGNDNTYSEVKAGNVNWQGMQISFRFHRKIMQNGNFLHINRTKINQKKGKEEVITMSY